MGFKEKMPVYEFKAITDGGNTVTGQEIAESQSALEELIQSRGHFLQSVKPVNTNTLSSIKSRINTNEFILFNQEFISLLKAGLTIPDSLELVSRGKKENHFYQILIQIKKHVQEGLSLSEACLRYPNTFDPLYITTLKIGEKSGSLENVLEHYQKTIKQQSKIHGIVKQAMIYPIFLFITLIVIMTVLFVFVLPRFAELYSDIGTTLPLPTLILVKIVDKIYLWFPSLLFLSFLSLLSFKAWHKTKQGKHKWDKFKFKIPFIGKILLQYAQVHLVRSLAMLLKSGTPLLEAIQTTGQSFDNMAFSQSLKFCTRRLTEGSTLANCIAEEKLLPDSAIKMVQVGEASGSLPEMLFEIASYFDSILESQLNKVSSLIEPIMMLLMGIMIGGTIIVMYLPIFFMAEVLG